MPGLPENSLLRAITIYGDPFFVAWNHHGAYQLLDVDALHPPDLEASFTLIKIKKSITEQKFEDVIMLIG